jgi:hypothetical protein
LIYNAKSAISLQNDEAEKDALLEKLKLFLNDLIRTCSRVQIPLFAVVRKLIIGTAIKAVEFP